jgi:tyrosyl-tRNA synthetase
MFTLLSREEIEGLIAEHDLEPHARILQKRLAKELTVMVHSEKDYEMAVNASNVLFGKSTKETLESLDDQTFLSVFEGVPTFEVSKCQLSDGVKLSTLTVEQTPTFKSKGELRKLISNGGVSINKTKITEDITVTNANLINDKFLLVQQGKKNYTLVIAR